ncbi:hypothetical protein [Sphingobacterium sp. HMA12]|uniref:hypothetical protein n=1 Tax=Sphingobacterium sp. HMA12 TaxID=2050894 RepID=UPI000CEA027C|nr:hypothetical protein [Sphingobacterium sp. HMA12]
MLWKGRRNMDGGTGESGTAVDTMGAEVMETGNSWEKVYRSEKRDAKHNSRVRKGSLPTRRSRDRKPLCPQQRTSRKDRRPEKKPMNRQIGSWTGIKTAAANKPRRPQKNKTKACHQGQ